MQRAPLPFTRDEVLERLGAWRSMAAKLRRTDAKIFDDMRHAQHLSATDKEEALHNNDERARECIDLYQRQLWALDNESVEYKLVESNEGLKPLFFDDEVEVLYRMRHGL